MINPNAELFRWGPIPGRPIYISYFLESIAESFPQKYKYKYKWPEIFFYFIKENMTFICEYPLLRECGKKYFYLSDQEFKNVQKKYDAARQELHHIYPTIKNLHLLTDKQLLAIYQQWQNAYFTFWDHGLIPELANWGGEQELKEKLGELNLGTTTFITALEKLSAPEKLSFYQEEELDLLQEPLAEHTLKYFWITNSYFETTVLDTSYFQQRLLEIKDRKQKIEHIKNFPQNVKQEKQNIINQLHLSPEIQHIAERLSYCIWWQDARKKEIFIAGHYITTFLKEITRRYKITFKDLEVYWAKEIEQLLLGKPLSQKEIHLRQEQLMGYYNQEHCLVISDPAEFKNFVTPFLEKKIDNNLKELKGTVASIGKGTVQGKVKILLTAKEWPKMNQGDILVAPMTSPEFIVAMRKAAAIITDEGGLTSHAAIVSRELGIPCIVGTSIATKLLKDNDVVEVDAKRGIIRRLNNKKVLTKIISRDLAVFSMQLWTLGYLEIQKVFGFGYNIAVGIKDHGTFAIYRSEEEHRAALDAFHHTFLSNPEKYQKILDDTLASVIKIKELLQEKPLDIKQIEALYIKAWPGIISSFYLPDLISQDSKNKKLLARNNKVRQRTESYYDLVEKKFLEFLQSQGIPEKTARLFSREELHGKKKLPHQEESCIINGYTIAKKSVGREIEKLGYVLERDEVIPLTQVSGNSVYPGLVQGKAKIIFNKREISKVNTGDILIAPMTTPDFLPAMKKAAALVTDEGGILCHAAIVAREMKKPCVIGTKIATKIFKDGDKVEVDATAGIVRKCL